MVEGENQDIYNQSIRTHLVASHGGAYVIAEKIIRRVIAKNTNDEIYVLDLASGNAPILCRLTKNFKKLNCTLVDIDSNTDYLKSMLQSSWNNDTNKYDLITEDVNVFLEKKRDKACSDKKYDLILINAAFHELWVHDKDEYIKKTLNKLFENFLSDLGVVYIGDFHYYLDEDDNVTKKIQQRDKFIEYQRKLHSDGKHCDDLEKFIDPKYFFKVINDKEYILVDDNELKIKIPDYPSIHKYYYSFLIAKKV